MKKVLTIILACGALMLITAGFSVEQQSFTGLMKRSLAPFVVGIGFSAVPFVLMSWHEDATGETSRISTRDLGIAIIISLCFGIVSILLTLFGWCLWQLYFLVVSLST